MAAPRACGASGSTSCTRRCAACSPSTRCSSRPRWQRLTLGQRGVLRALVLEDGRSLLSADVRTRYRLGGASSVQAALGALQKQDVVTRDADRYVVVDSLMREWIARRTF